MNLFFCLCLLATVDWASSVGLFNNPSKEVDSSEFGGPPGKKGTTCRCGWTNKPGKRVVGGNDTGMNEYPYMVSIVDGQRRHLCGGTVITPYHILTAAQCTNKKGFMSVRVGDHSLKTQTETPFTQEIQIKKIVQHENFDNVPQKHDISMLVLSTPIKFNDKVGPVCLSTGKMYLENHHVKLIGWGKTSHNGSAAYILQDASLRIVPHHICTARYPKHVRQDPRTQICAYGTGKGFCQGDAGGPLLWLDPVTNRYVLSGIVSFGKICASEEDPGVFTDVTAYSDWIKAKIDENSPSPVAICSRNK